MTGLGGRGCRATANAAAGRPSATKKGRPSRSGLFRIVCRLGVGAGDGLKIAQRGQQQSLTLTVVHGLGLLRQDAQQRVSLAQHCT